MRDYSDAQWEAYEARCEEEFYDHMDKRNDYRAFMDEKREEWVREGNDPDDFNEDDFVDEYGDAIG